MSLRYPAVVLSHGNAEGMVPQDQPLHTLPKVICGVDVGVCQQMCTKVATEFVSPGCWNHSFQVRGQSQFSQSKSEGWFEFSQVFGPVLSLG